MQKQLIIGTATLAIVGSMLLGSTMYAASGNALTTSGTHQVSHHNRQNHDQMKTILATLPADIQTQLQTIHKSYQTKEQALHVSEKAEVNAILANYPDVKAKLDRLREDHREYGKDRGDDRKEEDDADDTMTSPHEATS